MISKSLLILFSLSFFIPALFAQTTDTLKTEDIEIINIYEPVISDAYKTLETPRIIDTTPPAINVKYDLLKRHLKTEFHIDTIKAATMKSEPLPKLYRTYIKLGGGNHFATLADASYHNLRSRENSYGARFRHYGAYNPTLNNTFSQFSENGLSIYGTKFLTDHAISAKAEHSRDIIHFYGFNTDSFPNITKSSIRQRFAFTRGKAAVESFFKDSSAINYTAGIQYFNLSDLFNAQENNVLINADLNRFYGKEDIHLSASLDINDFKNSLEETSIANGVLKVHPYIVTRRKRLHLNAGLGIFADAERAADFYFYPIAEFRYHVVQDLLIPYAGITGRVARNSFHSFTSENPFLISTLPLKNSLNNLEFYGGIRGAESSEISFNAGISLSEVKNIPLYVTDSTYLPENKFTVVYDNIEIVNYHAELGYDKEEKVKIVFRGDYSSYETYYEAMAWYKPQWRGNISAFYNLYDKIIFKTDLFGISSQFAKSSDPLDKPSPYPGIFYKELKGIIDANLGAEYRYNNRLSAFVSLNNLGGIRYYQWENYPAMRFNVLGGLSYSF